MNSNTRFITRTAILIALTVVIQMIGRFLPPSSNVFVVGPLVNACLIVATAFVGLWSGIIIAVLSPFTSLINNHAAIAPILFLFSPFIAIGNAVLVAAYYALKKKNQIAALIVGAVLKFAFLLGAMKIFASVRVVPAPVIALFGNIQLITALLGGAVALVLIKALEKNLDINKIG